MDRWWIDGAEVPAGGSTLPLDDRGLAYGDGLFETIAIRDGALRWPLEHLQRLQTGCNRLAIDFDAYGLQQDLPAYIDGINHGVLKIIVTRGSGPRGYSPLEAGPARCIAGVAATEPAGQDKVANGVRVQSCITSISLNPSLAGMKTLNRLEQVLARSEVRDPAVSEGLMFDAEGHLICGTMSNVFLVGGDHLHTPVLTNAGVQGVMRSVVMRLAEEHGVSVHEREISREEIIEADGAFLTNSLVGLWPVVALDKHKLSIPPLTRRFCGYLAEAGVEECAGVEG